MKKFFVFFILFCPIFLFCGCGSNIDNVEPSNINYTMDLSFDKNEKILYGNIDINYTNNLETSLTELVFNLYPNAFAEGVKNPPVSLSQYQKAYPNGASYGKIEIEDVVLNGTKQTYEIFGDDNTFLKIPVGELFPNEQVNIQIAFYDVLPNVLHRYGYGDSTYNFANFYPVLCVYDNGFVLQPYSSNGDPFYSDMANYDVNITIDNSLKIASSGECISKVDNDDNTSTYNYKSQNLRDFAFVLSEKFELASSKVDDITINYYYYEDENFEKNLQAGVDSIITFNELFGDYPYNVLNIVKCDFIHGGMEYPNLIYISAQVTNPNDYLNVIVHETAHQWWYSVVGSNAFKYPWLDEGLTEYSTVLFYENNPQYNVNKDDMIHNANESYKFFIEVYTSVYGSVDTTMNRALNEYKTEPEYVYNTYVKGMLLFNSLRTFVGDKKFFKAIQTYYNTFAYKNINPDGLIAVFEDICNKDVRSFINSWIEGKVKFVA